MTAERSPAPSALEPGALLGGRYRLEERIGSGGVAVVWLAVDEVLDRHVAVKLLRPRSADDPEIAQRFRREATAAAGVTHAHTVTVYDVGEHDGEPFLVMELIEGPALADLIDATDGVPPALVVEIGRQVASALGAGHARGLVHSDVT
ncbi:MAG: serine/threonine-protein kinase, partial [Nitriliruptorales bacterium]